MFHRLCRRLLLAAMLATWATLLAGQTHAQTTLRIAAIVNRDVITVQDLFQRLNLVLLATGAENDQETRARLGPQVLRTYIDETLKLQEARRLGITVTAGEVRQALVGVAARNGMSVEELLALLRQRGIGIDTLERQIRAELAWARVVNRQIRPEVVVSEEQIDLALATRKEADAEEVLLSEILLPIYRPEQEAQVLEDARRIIEAVKSGADFGALARQVSVAASAADQGNLGWVALANLNEVVRPVIERLEIGVPSEPVRTANGIRIFLVRDRRSGGSGASEELVELAQLVIPLSTDATEEEVRRALREAEAVRPRLRDCARVAGVARELDAPASGPLGWMPLGELPTDFAAAVARLRVGEVTPPLRGPLGIHLLTLCSRGGAEGERQRIRLELEREQVQRLANRYLRDLRKSAYIEIRLR